MGYYRLLVYKSDLILTLLDYELNQMVINFYYFLLHRLKDVDNKLYYLIIMLR